MFCPKLEVEALEQGELEITAEAGADGKAPVPQRTPFLMLGLDLPPAPLYKDALERNIIPQVRSQILIPDAGPGPTSRAAG